VSSWAWLWLAAAPQVLVLPTRSVDVSFDLARGADRAAARALGPSHLAPRRARQRLGGRQLGELADSCGFDAACLGELALLSGADAILSPKLSSDPDRPARLRLELVAIDAETGKVRQILRWSVEPANLRAAVASAVRRASLPPDARLRVETPNAALSVSVYGEPVDWPLQEPFPFWSGRWDLQFSAPGAQSETRTLEVQPGSGVQVLRVELAPDLLGDSGSGPEPRVEVFDEPSRRVGSGVTAQSLQIPRVESVQRRPWKRVWPWLAVGASSVAVVAGTVLAADAQGRYNRVASEPRAVEDTTPAAFASDARRDARDQMTVGQAVLWPGAVGLVASLIWAVASQ
jgi:hypothetical protein